MFSSTKLQHKDIHMDHTAVLLYGTYTILKFDGLPGGHRCFWSSGVLRVL